MLWPGLKPTSVELKQAGTFVRTPCQLSPQMEIMLLGQWLWLSRFSDCFRQLRSAVQISTSAKFFLPIVNGKDQNKEIVAGKWTIFKECIMLRNWAIGPRRADISLSFCWWSFQLFASTDIFCGFVTKVDQNFFAAGCQNWPKKNCQKISVRNLIGSSEKLSQ